MLPNRRANEYDMKCHGEKLKEKIVCFSIDLNNLKETNDTFGHEAGDKIIRRWERFFNMLQKKMERHIGSVEMNL
jgi:diguanylate cyclase (GGDEF)-like protein